MSLIAIDAAHVNAERDLRMTPPPRARDVLAMRIRDLLTQRGVSQAKLAAAVHRSPPLISQVLRGKRGISIDLLDALAHFFEVEVSDLFRHDAQEAPPALTKLERQLIEGFRAGDERIRAASIALLGVADFRPERKRESGQTRQYLVHLVANLSNTIEALAEGGDGADRK